MEIKASLKKYFNLNLLEKEFNTFLAFYTSLLSINRAVIPVDKYYLPYLNTDQHFCYHFVTVERVSDHGVYVYDYLLLDEFFIACSDLEKAMRPSDEPFSQGFKLKYFQNNPFNFDDVILDKRECYKDYRHHLKESKKQIELVCLKLKKNEQNSSVYYRLLSKWLFQTLAIMDINKAYYRIDIMNHFLGLNDKEQSQWWLVQSEKYRYLSKSIENKPEGFFQHVNTLKSLIEKEIEFYEGEL
ncbi:hypothetical protein [uncultured Vagococcus sp.]|uniref:hypothetical protein n=1 Tax=uncultured Vagococcus sp. TaxID=189676 RepID=UPI0028D75C0F|nr:hypothetical protein [uncultured Vagococcus sp.]